jgi:hypothetical protein
MRCGSAVLAVAGLLATLVPQSAASGPFVLFPKAGQLASPDGRLVVSTAQRQASASEFAGTFDSLWLTEIASGRTRKLCDYFGVAAVAWSGNNFLLVTQYVGKRASRVLVLSIARPDDSVMLDSATLGRMVPLPLQTTLRQNNHVFVEAGSLESGTLHLTVWGYGPNNPKGFRWRCEYGLSEGELSCADEQGAK